MSRAARESELRRAQQGEGGSTYNANGSLGFGKHDPTDCSRRSPTDVKGPLRLSVDSASEFQHIIVNNAASKSHTGPSISNTRTDIVTNRRCASVNMNDPILSSIGF